MTRLPFQSVDFHENGRRHKENVARRLKNVAKKSARDQVENEKFQSTLRQIESAALEAYQRDVEQNRDLTSVAINNRLEKDGLAVSGGSKKVWYEAKTNEGRTYYWNTLTNGTSCSCQWRLFSIHLHSFCVAELIVQQCTYVLAGFEGF